MKAETNILIAVIKQAGSGDEKAQALLYHQFSKAMYNICLRMTASRQDAEDLLQESFVLAFRNLHQLKDAASFGGWLKRIIVNECIRYSRQKLRWQDLEDHHHELPEDDTGNWIREIPFQKINEEIKNLPQACRTVFNLYVMEDYAHKDIATALGISESTSKSQYHRARQLLKERILKLQTNG
ncbi:MAG: RNA polymerase sigma factor [Chitinophagaceae bacterium]